MHECLQCGNKGSFQSFVYDYFFDTELDDEVAALKCPNCGEDDEERIVEIEEVTNDKI